MNIFQFLNYIIFNKDGHREEVINQFKKHFSDLQTERWRYLRERLSN